MSQDILSYNNASQYYCFPQINAAYVSIKDFKNFQKINLTYPKLFNSYEYKKKSTSRSP